jgi:hypothetical protein
MRARTLIAALAVAAGLGALPPVAAAQEYKVLKLNRDLILTDLVLAPFVQTWKCTKGSGGPCSSSDMANPAYKQILLLPAGFAEAERSTFFSEFDRMVDLMSNQAGTAWSAQQKAKLLYIGYFVAGGPINSATAAFQAKIPPHPVRGFATSLDQDAVYAKVGEIQRSLTHLRPLGVGVLFNSFQTGVTANASPPSFVKKPYGIGKWTRHDLNDRGAYLPAHELAHAGLNLLDEYVEAGFENMSIRSIDVATPLVAFDWTWGGLGTALGDLFDVYDINISETLAHNGNDNISLYRYPATVDTPGFSKEVYEYEGGMFFGRGTWHDQGNNLMNSGRVKRASDDDFAFAHSASQSRVVSTIFVTGQAGRANDRLRNAGPKNGWPLSFGSTTRVMLFDADKNNHFHPTDQYSVQVGWYEREWKACWWGPFPYPCYTDHWKTAEKAVTPTRKSLDFKLSSAFGLLSLAQNVLCAVGVNELPMNGKTFRICEESLTGVADNFLPTVKFYLPYQDVTVPASQWMTTYYWRFRAHNNRAWSGWTGWSSFFRSL